MATMERKAFGKTTSTNPPILFRCTVAYQFIRMCIEFCKKATPLFSLGNDVQSCLNDVVCIRVSNHKQDNARSPSSIHIINFLCSNNTKTCMSVHLKVLSLKNKPRSLTFSISLTTAFR